MDHHSIHVIYGDQSFYTLNILNDNEYTHMAQGVDFIPEMENCWYSVNISSGVASGGRTGNLYTVLFLQKI